MSYIATDTVRMWCGAPATPFERVPKVYRMSTGAIGAHP